MKTENDWKAAKERSRVPEMYRWDLTHIYSSDAAWGEAKEGLRSVLPRLGEFRGKLGTGPAVLADFLDLMTEYEMITARERDEAKSRPLSVKPPNVMNYSDAPYFVDYLQDVLQENRLAAPAPPQNREDLSPANLKAHVGQDRFFPKASGDPLHGNDRFFRAS